MKLEDVAILGVGMTRFGVYRERSVLDIAREAGLAALDDAGISFAEIDEAFVGYIFDGPMTGIRAMKEFGLTGEGKSLGKQHRGKFKDAEGDLVGLGAAILGHQKSCGACPRWERGSIQIPTSPSRSWICAASRSTGAT